MAAFLLIQRELAARGMRKERVFRDRTSQLDTLSDGELMARYRMPREALLQILQARKTLIMSETNRSHALTAETQMLVTMRYLSKGGFLMEMGDLHGISESSVSRVFDRTLDALISKLPAITFPNRERNLQETQQNFFKLAGMPKVLGAIDGTHIPIKRPEADEAAYVCRKGYHSINVQAICDVDLKFLNVVAKWPGSTHDAFILTNSTIGQTFEQNPPAGWLLGDSGYPCRPWLLTPLPEPNNRAEERFNRSHIRSRNTIERAFGVLKSRFRVETSEDVITMEGPYLLVQMLDGRFVVNEKNLKLLSQIKTPIVVLSLVGPYRSGKSYLGNLLMEGKNQGFGVGNEMEACTKGIWAMWKKHPKKKNCTLVMLDSEGLGDTSQENRNNDINLLALLTLLSSTLIFNKRVTLDSQFIEMLGLVTEFAKLIGAGCTTTEEIFPPVVCVLRDFYLYLSKDGKPRSADEYLENALQPKTGTGRRIDEYNSIRERFKNNFKKRKCFILDRPVADTEMLTRLETLPSSQLDPKFLKQFNELKEDILTNSDFKKCKGTALNGSALNSLLKMYVDAFNSGRTPDLEDTFTALEKVENQKARQKAMEVYRTNWGDLVSPAPSLDYLAHRHDNYTEKAKNTYHSLCFCDSDGAVLRQLEIELKKEYERILAKNETISKKHCEDLLLKLGEKLEEKVQNGEYFKLGRLNSFRKDRDAVIKAYQDTPNKGFWSERILERYKADKEKDETQIRRAHQELRERNNEQFWRNINTAAEVVGNGVRLAWDLFSTYTAGDSLHLTYGSQGFQIRHVHRPFMRPNHPFHNL